jgi:hypothetical protein
MTTLSLRRLWTVYKRTLIESGTGSKRELATAHGAFYSGARGVLMVLDHMAECGDMDEMNRIVRRFGKQIRAIRSSQPRRSH